MLTPARQSLEVYVASHCPGCEEAQRLAHEVSLRFPQVEVRVVDLDTGARPPEAVVAVPTYVVDGRVAWLGNPEPEDLFNRLSEAAV